LAFENVEGIKVISHQDNRIFLIGDYFSVYEGDSRVPVIYEWTDVKSVTENKHGFIFLMQDDSLYKIGKTLINGVSRQLKLRAIVEGNIAKYPYIEHRHQKRVLPAKTHYTSCDMPSRAYSSKGVYNEKEISYSNVTLLNIRLGKLFIVVGIIITLAAFLFCIFVIKDVALNLKYYIPISVFCGVIIAMFIYIACAIVAKYIYSSLAKVDVTLDQEITFVIAEEGFSAIETELHSGFDLVRWDEVAYFVETNYVFIIYKNKRAVFWLPKRLFTKDRQKEISNFIAARLNQK
jgi:hypothetical protein